MNVFTFDGFLGQDAQLRGTDKPVLGFSVAVQTGYGDREKTEWVRCSSFSRRTTGKLVNYLLKGTHVIVTGGLSLNTYKDKTNIEVNVTEITLIGGKQDKPAQKQTPNRTDEYASTGEVPF